MDAKKCDRCGAFYVVPETKTDLAKIAAALNSKAPKHITDVCDLCPECVKDFYSWLREAHTGENARKL